MPLDAGFWPLADASDAARVCRPDPLNIFLTRFIEDSNRESTQTGAALARGSIPGARNAYAQSPQDDLFPARAEDRRRKATNRRSDRTKRLPSLSLARPWL